MPQGVQLAKTTLLFSSTKDAYLFFVQMDIIFQALFAIHAMALAILVLEGQIQTASLA